MDYNGTELEAFDKAHIWRKYIYHLIKKFLKKDILEVGAGIGSFTINYLSEDINATLTDPDTHNSSVLKEKFSNNNNVKVFKCFVNEIKEKFHNILYLNVLEHIEDDVGEIEQAIEKLNTGGTLIILVPAHQKLYGNLDKAVGHFKRYDISFFENLSLKNAKIKDLYYLDCTGYFLYFINKLFFKEEVYPSKFKILVWDKLFTPFTIILDKIINYKFGKNLMCIIEKN
jgi:SAM-dependent methyltransferase|tara:strand:- start:2399 stop:3082 length:684 start_codon:yes stop_codon:yes gene_type:complete